MRLHDPVYGPLEISEPVLLDLLETQALRRLTGVLQHGITGLIGVTSPTTRWQHSLGAMWLVRSLGGSLQEQIAALLHDVSHTAFSHVIDYVYHDHQGQSYHEEQKAWYVEQSDLPATLTRHGYDWRDFLDEAAYPLLEQPAPALCADRVDYFLRDGVDLALLSPAEIDQILQHLVVAQGRMAVDSLAVAQVMAYQFIAADDKSWANFAEVALYELTAQALRLALDLGAITEADFWGVDETLWRKLSACQNADLQYTLQLISPTTKFEWAESDSTFRVGTKIRTIDPDVVVDGGLHPLSTLDPDFAAYRRDYLQRKAGLWPIKVVTD